MWVLHVGGVHWNDCQEKSFGDLGVIPPAAHHANCDKFLFEIQKCRRLPCRLHAGRPDIRAWFSRWSQ